MQRLTGPVLRKSSRSAARATRIRFEMGREDNPADRGKRLDGMRLKGWTLCTKALAGSRLLRRRSASDREEHVVEKRLSKEEGATTSKKARRPSGLTIREGQVMGVGDSAHPGAAAASEKSKRKLAAEEDDGQKKPRRRRTAEAASGGKRVVGRQFDEAAAFWLEYERNNNGEIVEKELPVQLLIDPRKVCNIPAWERYYNHRSLSRDSVEGIKKAMLRQFREEKRKIWTKNPLVLAPIYKRVARRPEKAERVHKDVFKPEDKDKYFYYPVNGQHTVAAVKELEGEPIFDLWKIHSWPARVVWFSDEEFAGYLQVPPPPTKTKMQVDDKFFVVVKEPDTFCWHCLADMTDVEKLSILDDSLALRGVFVQSAGGHLKRQHKPGIKDRVATRKVDRMIVRMFHYILFFETEEDEEGWRYGSHFFRTEGQLLAEFGPQGLTKQVWVKLRRHFQGAVENENTCKRTLPHEESLDDTRKMYEHDRFPRSLWEDGGVTSVRGPAYGDMERNPSHLLGRIENFCTAGQTVFFFGKEHASVVWELLRNGQNVVALEDKANMIDYLHEFVKTHVADPRNYCSFVQTTGERNWDPKRDMYWKLPANKRTEVWDFLFQPGPPAQTDLEYSRRRNLVFGVLNGYHDAPRESVSNFLRRLEHVNFLMAEPLTLENYKAQFDEEDPFDAEDMEEVSDSETFDFESMPLPRVVGQVGDEGEGGPQRYSMSLAGLNRVFGRERVDALISFHARMSY
ncbi:hypothetical protein CBR_g57269 [Chara braunii]|uniref:Uncharacterized protein n=1 Tax=Chara braunii TaxID=69332 RepID=A0A388ME17_CHABU|nr:hypothetical protein CBR_g57269 [Chara braunii]|eukprot:GBG92804.1 hypothetical protein CBR_g57269 [Chara braunii]